MASEVDPGPEALLVFYPVQRTLKTPVPADDPKETTNLPDELLVKRITVCPGAVLLARC